MHKKHRLAIAAVFTGAFWLQAEHIQNVAIIRVNFMVDPGIARRILFHLAAHKRKEGTHN